VSSAAAPARAQNNAAKNTKANFFILSTFPYPRSPQPDQNKNANRAEYEERIENPKGRQARRREDAGQVEKRIKGEREKDNQKGVKVPGHICPFVTPISL
jgi:hypothetical protein